MSRGISKKYSNSELMFLEVVRKMPPLYHKMPDEDFDINKSEVVEWLMKQPEIKQFIFEKASNRSDKLKPMKYNHTICKWQGVDYNDD